MRDLHGLLWIVQKSRLVCPNGLEFLHELLSRNDRGMALQLKDVSFNATDKDEVTTILDIYEMLHVIHSKVSRHKPRRKGKVVTGSIGRFYRFLFFFVSPFS